MKILSKILLSLLMLLSLNSFAKGRVCSQNPEDLINNLNFAYEKRDGGAFYDLITNESALRFEKEIKEIIPHYLPYLKRAIKRESYDKKLIREYNYIRDLSNHKKRTFFVHFFNLFFVVHSSSIPKKVNLTLVDEKIVKNNRYIIIQNAKDHIIKVLLVKEDGCLKFTFEVEHMDIFK